METKLFEELTANGVGDSTAKLYIRNLRTLNGGSFKNILFLKDVEAMEDKLKDYKDNTKKTYYASICSVLKGKKPYSKPYKHYYEKMMGLSKDIKEKDGENEKSETQKENWIRWEDVEKSKGELKSKLGFKSRKLTKTQYDTLLSYLVLSLYTDIAPRRNMDYLLMDVSKTKNVDTTKNWYIPKERVFVFNKYKTAKKYGQQTLDTTPIEDALKMYLKYHPLAKEAQFPLLVDFGGKPLKSVNAITRILNRIFKKKVGSSMLRHIYLSSKYGDELEEMKKDSIAMSHNLNEQRNYIKND
jgi:hypothetical protein